MKADLTRNTFSPAKHFTRVLMQQGRVQLDADWNEQAAIVLHYLRSLAKDLIGNEGGPDNNLGFKIGVSPVIPRDITIGGGRYYVGGILCESGTPVSIVVKDKQVIVQASDFGVDGVEFARDQYVEAFPPPASPAPVRIVEANPETGLLTLSAALTGLDASAPKMRRIATYTTQPYYPLPENQKLDQLTVSPPNYLVYLDVWERHITYIEEPSIREVALGGPDTATRTQVIWQVKLMKLNRDGSVPELPMVSRAALRARARQVQQPTDPCVIPPEIRYRGAENQLYRVEVHRSGVAGTVGMSGAASATFKWSREDGSVIFRIVEKAQGQVVTLANLGRDARFGLDVGDWVEIVDDDYVLQNRAERLLQVLSIDPVKMRVTLSGAPDSTVGQDLSKHPLLRRWDQKAGDPAEGGLQLQADGTVAITEGSGDTGWLLLEDGIQIRFQAPSQTGRPNRYRTGDYWLIPARTVTGDVEWPTETDSRGNLIPAAVAPNGVEHHYAALATVSVNAGGVVALVDPADRRRRFTALAK